MSGKIIGDNVAAWLRGKSIEELAAVRHGRQLLFPDALTYYGAGIKPREDKILIRVPRGVDRERALIQAMLYVQQKVPQKSSFKVETREAAQKFIGADRFEVIEICAIVAACSHDGAVSLNLAEDKMPPPYMGLEMLMEEYSESTILDVYEHMDLLSKMLNPRFESLTPFQAWACVEAASEKQTASFLAGMLASTQLDWLLWVCRELWSCRTSSSSFNSLQTSTPEPSP
jgi:hypothetical protein